MLSSLRDLLFRSTAGADNASPDRVHVATCVLLLEVAGADDEFSAVEREHVVTTLRERFGLSEREAEELLEASAAERGERHDLWHFTHAINEGCTKTEKLEILDEVWRVIYADGTLDAHEDYLVHKLAKLLNLNHPELIASKLKVRNTLNQ